MIKEKYLKPLKEIAIESDYLTKRINFLESASDSELHDLGLCVKSFFSPYLERENPSFWEEYAKDYGISAQITSEDKIRMNRLYRALEKNSNLTVAEFLKTQRHV
ncbi:hypothetical protein SuUB85_11450 [Streptococcus uberis]|uniref:hypothetical protein n=1 Tax=Streptococcus uberis TaxID=1349 RepID=UPI001FF1E278|nr:hypothetical protein [Streptococcus uberis]MCK1190072.1 hypothetical protein [Streptococcus uberis]MCK1196590.1 hypothetical protein [Streptococcus uberis]